MVRGSGKFKQKRGGGRNFSKNMVLDEDGTAVSTDRKWARRDKDADGSDKDSEEGSEEEEEEEEEEESEEESGEEKTELTRTERRELKKKQAAEKQPKKASTSQVDGAEEDDDDDDLVNPNHGVGKRLNISDLNSGKPRDLSRKEREAKEKKEAQDRYWKLHVQGKTDEAKSDLARLAKIRADREAAQAKRKAEAEAREAELKAKQAAQKAAQAKRVGT